MRRHARSEGRGRKAVVAAQNHHDPGKGDEKTRKEPPARANAVEENGKKDRKRGPEVVHHADLDRLRAPFGKEDRQAEAERAQVRGRQPNEEIALVHAAEVRHPNEKEEKGGGNAVKHALPLREAEAFGDAAHEADRHAPADGCKESDQG